jgi:hypothetical protein
MFTNLLINDWINTCSENTTWKTYFRGENVRVQSDIWRNHANFMLSVIIEESDRPWYQEMLAQNLIYDC